MFYFELLKELFNRQIQYLIVGGLAVNLHGIPRVTQDIDIIILMTNSNIKKINSVLKELNYIPRLPINPEDLMNRGIVEIWIKDRNLKALSFYHKTDDYKGVDIVLVHPLDFEEAFKKRITKKIDNIEIYIVSIEDLIAMKVASGRGQDLSDVAMLEKVKQFLEGE
ncbi:MAG: nucleotidyl transferase AbiEii/AbiGii toxin family protein [Promethearchaeota archaeon]